MGLTPMLVSGETEKIIGRAKRGDELDEEDVAYLYDYADLKELGREARKVADSISGNRVSFVSNLILNYTNICNVRCKFCAFYRTGKEEDSYSWTEDQVVEEIGKYYGKFGIRQLLIQGGVNPALDADYFYAIFRRIRKEFPSLGIHGLSTSEISFFSRKAKLSVEAFLEKLRESGLETIPGAGGEIFDSEIRVQLGRPRDSGKEWLSIMETAHRMGIKTSSTMMYGHVEESVHKARHLLSILALQKKYHGFLSFTPWNFEPGNTELERAGKVKFRAGGEDVLRNIAIARIVFGKELPVIQSSWLTNGIEMGQLAVMFGANDWGGTIYDEKVIPATGRDVGNLRKETIITSLRNIGMVPVERDNLYRTVEIFQ